MSLRRLHDDAELGDDKEERFMHCCTMGQRSTLGKGIVCMPMWSILGGREEG